MKRDLNDLLYGLVRGLKSSAGDFTCECGQDACDRSVQLTLPEYCSNLRSCEVWRLPHAGVTISSPEHAQSESRRLAVEGP
jgi:hypothetical protein